MRRRTIAIAAALLVSLFASAKDSPLQVITWPSEQNPILRFTFGKLREQSSNGHERAYASDVVVENLWSKPIASAEFSVYLFDKNNTRIGEGYIQFTNARAGETIKFQANFFASGAPASLTLVGRRLPGELQSLAPAQMVSLTVNSIPQGAELKIDGKPWGTTPKLVEVSTGDHLLEFTLQGFSTGHFPLVVRPNDISGGSVTFELGTAAHDTVELRDGTVITGDVQSMNATEVRVTVGGANQTIDRNKVKRILLVERTSPQ